MQTYRIGYYLSCVLLLVFFIFSIYRIADATAILWIFVAWGIIYLLISKKNFSTIKKYSSTKWFLLILVIFALRILIDIIIISPEKLFEFRFDVYKLYFFLPFLIVIIHQFFPSLKDFKKIIILSAVSLFFVIYQFIINDFPDRGKGIIDAPIIRGNLAMLIGLLSFVCIFNEKKSFWKILGILGFFCGLFTSLLTGSRGGWLALIIVVTTSLTVLVKFKKNYIKLGIILCIIFSFLAIIFLFIGDYFFHRILIIGPDLSEYFNGNHRSAVGYRLASWEITPIAFIENPIFGWGFNNWQEIQLYYTKEGMMKKMPLWGHPHNDFILVLTELGLMGLTLLLFIFAFLLIKFIKTIKIGFYERDKYLISLGLIGLAVIESILEFMLSDQAFSNKYLNHIFIVITLFLLIQIDLRKNKY